MVTLLTKIINARVYVMNMKRGLCPRGARGYAGEECFTAETLLQRRVQIERLVYVAIGGPRP